jgi:hypothetical protein
VRFKAAESVTKISSWKTYFSLQVGIWDQIFHVAVLIVNTSGQSVGSSKECLVSKEVTELFVLQPLFGG